MKEPKRYKRLFPWVGITDFATPGQVEMMANYHLQEMLRCKMSFRPLMVGVMMSYKTLHDLPTKWADAWVHKEDVNRVFRPFAHAFNTIHYADFDGLTTVEDLIGVVTYGGYNLDAVQFDMVWPDPSLLRSLQRIRPGLFFILQVNAHAFEQVDNNPTTLAKRLSEYEGVLDGVLLDKSMGRGLGLDALFLFPFINEVLSKHPNLTVGVAGGLGPDTLQLLAPLRQFLPHLAIDAQGKLRGSGNSLDPIDWDLAKKYVSEALAYFGSTQ